MKRRGKEKFSAAPLLVSTSDYMYTPPAFAEHRTGAMLDFMEARPFGALVTAAHHHGTTVAAAPSTSAHEDGALATGAPSHQLLATHIPFVLDRTLGAQGALVGHIARSNPQAHHLAALADGPHEAMVIFSGPDAYITPGWYPSKQEHGRVVPTWNYVTVHAYGTVQPFHDPSQLLSHLNALTGRHESVQAQPWAVADAPTGYVEQLLTGIVGIELRITRLEGSWKLSQNRPAADIEGVASGLGASDGAGDREMARLVVEHTPTSKRRSPGGRSASSR